MQTLAWAKRYINRWFVDGDTEKYFKLGIAK
jgi:hypothetical protein